MAFALQSIPLEDFESKLGTTSTEVSSVALGGQILGRSDEWFAPASDLLKVGPALSMKGQFGPAGALFDGWETRRHNPTYDWVIVRLGPRAGASIIGFDVDTANFNGNEAPEVEIYGLRQPADEEAKATGAIAENDARWTPLLPRTPCNPSSRHLYVSQHASPIYTHIKLHMIPDGGIARFRVYGIVPPPPIGLGVSERATSSGDANSQSQVDPSAFNVLDMAHVINGGQVVFTSDQHFGVGSNVLLPGRGKDMGDGWETKRSRTPGHKDWLIIKLGEPGLLNFVEIDTAHFLGNYPQNVELHATSFDGQCPSTTNDGQDGDWTEILSKSKLGPGKQHYFLLQNVNGKAFSHVRVTMLPDGGIKRVRIHGRRAAPLLNYSGQLPEVKLPKEPVFDKALPEQPLSTFANMATNAGAAVSNWFGNRSGQETSTTAASVPPPAVVPGYIGARHLEWKGEPAFTIRTQPLSSSAFAPYGDVIASPSALSEPDKPFKTVNQGTAHKYEALSDVVSHYPADAQAKALTHVYRCTPSDSKAGGKLGVRVLERHQFTKQSFIPMTKDTAQQQGYLVIVAKNGEDDLPDLTTLAAFTASGDQGIAYGAGTWHHPMIALGTQPTDFAVVVYESQKAADLNCDEVFWTNDVALIHLP